MRRWFKEKWVDVSRKDKYGKHPPCGRSEAKTDSKGYPKCRPSKKVSDKTPKTTRGVSAKEKKAMTRKVYRLLDYVAFIINTWDINDDFASYLQKKLNQ